MTRKQLHTAPEAMIWSKRSHSRLTVREQLERLWIRPIDQRPRGETVARDPSMLRQVVVPLRPSFEGVPRPLTPVGVMVHAGLPRLGGVAAHDGELAVVDSGRAHGGI